MKAIRAIALCTAFILFIIIPLNYIYFTTYIQLPKAEHQTERKTKYIRTSDAAREEIKALNKQVQVQNLQLSLLNQSLAEARRAMLNGEPQEPDYLQKATYSRALSGKEEIEALKKKVQGQHIQISLLNQSLAEAKRSMPSRDFQRLEHLHRLFNEKIYSLQNPQQCAKAKYLQCPSDKASCGFGCYLHRLSWCVSRAIEENRVTVIDPPIIKRYGRECDPEYFAKHMGGRFTCYFQDLSKCSEFYRKNAPRLDKKVMLFNDGWNKEHQEFLPPFLQDLRELIPRYYNAWYIGHIMVYIMRPSSRLQQIYRSSKFNRKYDFGIHIRRGDKLIAEALRYSLNEYMIHVDMFTHPGRIYHGHYHQKYGKSVYIASDDRDVFDEVQRFPQYDIFMNNATIRHASASKNSYADGLEGVLLDLMCLANATYFIGTMSSQLSRLVFEINYGRGVHDIHFRIASLDEDYYCAK